jgi:hypothetical protein
MQGGQFPGGKDLPGNEKESCTKGKIHPDEIS